MTSNVEYIKNLSTSCTHIKSGSQILTDAPTDNNGKGEKFSPTDLVATSLAACMLTVMGIKAEEDKIGFQNVSAAVEKIMESNPRRISEIKIIISIGEVWSKKEKSIMERTARTCPVAKSLHPDLLQEIEFVYTNESIS
jgi:putative redox protein